MKLQTLAVQNFKSFGKQQTINLSNLGLTLLVGDNQDDFQSNGAGKSSLLDAIIYALYGDVPNKTKKDNLVNRKYGKNMMVYLRFQIGKDEYAVFRYRKDNKYHNKTLLYLNGENITQRSIKKTNQYIQSVIGIDMPTYLHSYMFSGTGAKFASLTDSDKKKILDKMIDVSIFSKAHDVSATDAKTEKTKLDSLKNDKAVVQAHLESLNQLKQQAKENQSNLQNIKKEISDKEASLKGVSLDSVKHKIELLTNLAYSLQKHLDSYQSITEKKNKIQTSFNQYMTQIKLLNNDLASTKTKIKDFQDKTTKLVSQKQKTCYWCGQVLNPTQRRHESIKIGMKINSLLAHKGHVSQKLTRAVIKSNGYAQKLDKFKSSTSKLKDLTTKLNQTESGLNKAKSTQNAIESKKDILNALIKQYHQQSKVSLGSYKESLQKWTKRNAQDEESIQKSQHQYHLYKISEKVYSNHGVKSMMLDLVLPFINTQANHYLSILTDGDISLEIVPTTTSHSTGNTSEKINMKLVNNHGANTYEGLSSGEKRRVDLSIILSLQDYVLSKSTTQMNLICFDELFDNLDVQGVQDVVHLLKSRAKEFPSILVVSHNPKLQEWFDNKLIITKSHGISTITSE